jgi:hypothetical protein
MISIDHLWKFVVRGAIILCATNQSIDIVLPVCHMTQTLGWFCDSDGYPSKKRKGLQYKATLQGDLFDAMNSVVKSAIFSKLPGLGVDCDTDTESTTETLHATPAEPSKKKRKVSTMPKVTPDPVNPKAVIRMVFALASPEPAVVFRNLRDQARSSVIRMVSPPSTFGLRASRTKHSGRLEMQIWSTINRCWSVHLLLMISFNSNAADAFELKDIPGISKSEEIEKGL